MKYSSIYSNNNNKTPQNSPIPGREAEMTKNSAGGYTFQVSDWQRLERFLILGTEGGGYYVNEAKMTMGNLTSVQKCIQEDPIRVVNLIVDISDKGRAVKNDPAIFALALTIKFANEEGRKAAYAAIPKVCRIGTHLFSLTSALKAVGKGWGRGLKNAIANWYLSKEISKLAYDLAKYQQREGWAHRDVLRLAHPLALNDEQNSAFKWAVNKCVEHGDLPQILQGFEKIKKATSVKEVVSLINEYNLPRECVPTQYLNEPAVWSALLPSMPLTAMIRNLGNMTKCGLLTPFSDEALYIAEKLGDAEYIRKSRVHPISILLALKTYASGAGFRGSGAWRAVPQIVSALDKAFYMAFDNVEATGKKFFVGVDVSASMGSPITNSNLRSCEVAGAIAMTLMKTEPKTWVYGFCTQLVDLKLNPSMDLNTVTQNCLKNNFGSTDCAAAIHYATANNIDADVFVIITDNETWAGRHGHPSQALAEYRIKMKKPNAKMIVLATSPSPFTIADPKDPGMLDIAGFDTSIPTVISSFASM